MTAAITLIPNIILNVEIHVCDVSTAVLAYL